MGDKTFNQVELKPEMTSRHFTLYKTITILLLHQQGLASYVVYVTTAYSYSHKYRALQIQRQHTYTQDIHSSKFVIKGKACALKKIK